MKKVIYKKIKNNNTCKSADRPTDYTHTMYAKHNPIQDLVNATQRNLQYTAEANALSNDVQYIVSKPLQTLSSNSLATKKVFRCGNFRYTRNTRTAFV